MSLPNILQELYSRMRDKLDTRSAHIVFATFIDYIDEVKHTGIQLTIDFNDRPKKTEDQ